MSDSCIIQHTEIIAGALIIASFIAIIVTLLRFSKEKGRLRPRLDKVEKELKTIRDRLGPKKTMADELQKEVARLKKQEEPMRLYGDALREMEVGKERKTREGELKEQIATRGNKKVRSKKRKNPKEKEEKTPTRGPQPEG